MVKGIAKQIGIITGTTHESIHSRINSAIKKVITGITRDQIGSEIAGAIDVGTACEEKVLNDGVICKVECDRRLNCIGAAIGILDFDVLADDREGIVASGADESIACSNLRDSGAIFCGVDNILLEFGVGASAANLCIAAASILLRTTVFATAAFFASGYSA